MLTDLRLNTYTMPSHGHNIPVGPVHSCQVCGCEDIRLIVDLGHQPLCDTLLTADQLNAPEKYFPLRLFRCPRCTLTQLDYAVPGDEVYHPDYPYRSGITREVVAHMQSLADACNQRLGLTNRTGYVLDIGCNDGTLLKAFARSGVKTLGVEPTNIAAIARKEGIEVVQSFFNEAVALEIRRDYGAAQLITATNVFAHMTSLGDVMRGVKTLLADDGHFVIEAHYLVDILRKNQYDSIYHEHIRSYTLKSLVVLFYLYGMSVVHAEVMDRYSGTLRVFVSNNPAEIADRSVALLLAREDDLGLDKSATYEAFNSAIIRSRIDLLTIALDAKRRGMSFVGNSCPGRSSTLMNYVGIDRTLMPYICEQPTSLKLGLHLPGKHIPVVVNTCLEREQPEYILLLAWHYGESIIKELRSRGIRSKLILPLPEVKVIE